MEWKSIVLICLVGAAVVYYLYYGRDLASPQKDLLLARVYLLCIGAFFLVFYFTKPSFAYYVRTDLTHIQNIEEAKLALHGSNEVIERMAKDINDSLDMVTILLAFIVVLVLPSFLRISESFVS